MQDFCRGDVYGMGLVLWEIYTASEPGFRCVRIILGNPFLPY
jgi:hypothetical protein|eukprot:COSAG06_NODE_506_length_14931_cov_4.089873_8_plen_42_part_00